MPKWFLLLRRELEAQGKPYMCTSDIATWIDEQLNTTWYKE